MDVFGKYALASAGITLCVDYGPWRKKFDWKTFSIREGRWAFTVWVEPDGFRFYPGKADWLWRVN